MINIFNSENSLYSYRWLIMIIIASIGTMAYFDYTGDGIFLNSSQSQQWSSSGPGYHK